MKDFFLLLRVQPREALDHRADVVVPAAGPRVFLGAGTGTLGADEAAMGADESEKQSERFDAVKRGVEIELLQPFVEVLRIVGTAELRAPAADLVRNRPAAVRDDELQVGKVVEHLRAQKRDDRDALFGDEMIMERLALVAAARCVDERRQVELYELFIEWIPVFVAHARRLPVAFAGIRIDHYADEAELVDAPVELVETVFRTHPGALRQPADAAKAVGLELHLESDRVVDRLAIPADELLGLHRVHHRIRPRRDERPVGSDFL